MSDRNIEDIYPLSPMQAGMLFHALLQPDTETYVEQTRASLAGELDVEAFRQAWQRVMDRNPILRTAFVAEDVEEPLQIVYRKLELPFTVVDLCGLPADERSARVDELGREDRHRGFNLGEPPLLRLQLVRTSEQTWELIWTHHHILLDGWSLPILLREVFASYEAFSKHKPLTLPATRPYRDYIRYLKERKDVNAEAFWRDTLAGYEGPAPLTVERPRSDTQRIERNREQELWLGAEPTAALQGLARTQQLTINTVVGAAWSLLLSRYSGTGDVVFGTTVSGRPTALRGAESMVGLFINTLPVRARVDEDARLGDWLAAFQAHQAELRQYEHTPLVQIQGWSEVPRDTPLFESLLVFENYPTDKALAQSLSPSAQQATPGAANTLKLTGVQSFEQTNYSLTFVSGVGANAGAPAVMLKVSYDPGRYDDATVTRMLGHLRTLLEAMPDGLDRTVGALPLLTKAEQDQILHEWNAPLRDVPEADKRVSQRVAEQAAARPDAPAVVWNGPDGRPATLSYGKLNARADDLARQLRATGAAPGSIVALYIERSPELVVGLLGTMKSGAAYLPLDPAYPADRIAFMLADSAANVVLTQPHLVQALEATLRAGSVASAVLCVDLGSAEAETVPPASPAGAPSPSPDDPVYVIYTSGSTGTPKGVVVPHRALSNHASVMAANYGIEPGDRMLQFISPSFDAAGEQFWLPLVAGAAVVIPGEERDRLGEPLAEFCEQHGITHIHLAAPVWHQWCDDLAASGRKLDLPLKTLVVGGEPPSIERLKAWSALLPAPYKFINAYGPTEATVTTTLYAAMSDAAISAPVPIGKPITNAQVRVVDTRLRWLPQGAAGELLIGGAGLSLGYLGRPELTAERFIELPADAPLPSEGTKGDRSQPTMRFYRTGDVVRWLPDGSLAFAGRADDQVKIRGYRVEPGEIEAAIVALPGVTQAAVVGRKRGDGAARLVAYVVGQEDLDTGVLAEILGRRLPDYMVPSAWVVLSEMPLTPTGKIDRRRLPEPEVTGRARQVERKATADEETFAQLFKALLDVEHVTPADNFFDLGGHSLMATRLASRIREVFGVEVPLRALFENPTVEAMARVIAGARGDSATLIAPPIVHLPRGIDGLPVEPPPLSFGQQRLWFLDQLEMGPEGTHLLAYNTPAVVRLEGELNVEALRGALNEIVRRHQVLRTTFATYGGDPVQVIAPSLPVDLPLEDLTGITDAAEREQEAIRRAQAEARLPFDLAKGPVLRARLYRLGETDHIAIITAHHIAADGWSLGILIGELAALYEQCCNGEVGSAALPPLPVQYADYAAWQRRWLEGSADASPVKAQLDYWKQQLAGLPARLDLPTDRPRPAVQSSNGSTYAFRLPADLRNKLNALARAEGATLYMVLLAGYQALLGRYSGQDDIAVGSVVASRNQPELEALIGFFVNTLVFRTKLDGKPTFRELIARAREAALGAFAHQDVPFEMLVDAIQPRRELSHTPLFQAALSLQNVPMPAKELPGLALRSVQIERGTSQFDMLLSFTELSDGLGAAWEYNTDLFDRSTIERMARNLEMLLQAATAEPDQAVSALPILSQAERDLVLHTWNETTTPYPDNTTIHALIREWAAVTPEASAAEFVELAGGRVQARTLAYDHLHRKANQLARHLQSLGVGLDTLVGLSVERSLDMVVGILGILAAGGAYVPLDPNYPSDRLAFMMADSGIRVLVTQQAVQARLPLDAEGVAGNLQTVRLDADAGLIAAQDDGDLGAAVGPDNLAYCIYTSGSTGRPKGTLLRHRGLCNLADVQARAFDIRPGKRVLQFSPFSFDASVWETVMALRSGATLVLTRQETLSSGPDLLKLLREGHISTVTLPPSLLAVLEPASLPELETVVAAGERCTNEIVQRWVGGRRFFNAYGPTETTVCASMHLCDSSEQWPFGGPPIGKPISNFQCYIVAPGAGPNPQLQPIGVPGELLVGGAGVARGYLNRPELTAERFIQKPGFWAKPGSTAVRSTLYRTGDLVRWLPSGELDFLGRIDDQVKVRGFRIELGEIESVLREHPGVKEAVVTARGDSLVGYIIPKSEGAEQLAPTTAEMRNHLRQRLPEYMVPAVFVSMESFPLSPAGKVDRRALPAPDQARREAAVEYVAPRTAMEESLAAMCAELLGVERVGVEDNFFELGGHSLLATRLIARIRDSYQVELPLRTLFEKPTVAGLAEAIEQAKAAPAPAAPQAPTVTARSREGRRVSRSAVEGSTPPSGGTGSGGVSNGQGSGA